jgi:hypothetical protein
MVAWQLTSIIFFKKDDLCVNNASSNKGGIYIFLGQYVSQNNNALSKLKGEPKICAQH